MSESDSQTPCIACHLTCDNCWSFVIQIVYHNFHFVAIMGSLGKVCTTVSQHLSRSENWLYRIQTNFSESQIRINFKVFLFYIITICLHLFYPFPLFVFSRTFFAATTFARLSQDDPEGKVAILTFFNYVLRKIWMQQARAALSLWDSSGNGSLCEYVRSTTHFIASKLTSLLFRNWKIT